MCDFILKFPIYRIKYMCIKIFNKQKNNKCTFY